MKVLYGGVWIASGGTQSPQGFTVNGQQLVDEAQYFRALSRTYLPRFNRDLEVKFTVLVPYSTLILSEVNLLMQYQNLPDSGDVSFYCGPDAGGNFQVVTLQSAALFGVSSDYIGESVHYTYTFKGGIPRTDITPGNVSVDPSLYMRGTASIGSGASSVTVTFSAAMVTTPIVVANVQRPINGDAIWAIIRDGTVSTTGFTADLSGPTPGSGYLLSWVAML